MKSPIGWLEVCGNEQGITSVSFRDAGGENEGAESTAVREALRQLQAYFDGSCLEFEVPLAQEGTAFQQQVWQALTRIPAGETRTYSGLAQQLGNPGSVRAVGTANGANPIAVMVPCHRVIGADGSLTGYAGGLHRKEWLLAHEARLRPKGQLNLF
jgi:methylated-DNA-[protein]-cysteine S-methyltransferase